MSEPLDITNELRADADSLGSHPYTNDLLNRAADEIEHLRKENWQLKGTLRALELIVCDRKIE